MGAEKGEHFKYIKRESQTRMSFAVTLSGRSEVYKALRLGLLLHGYTAMLRRVNIRLPPPEPEEDPINWTLPLTSIRPYLLDQVYAHQNEFSLIMADSIREPAVAQTLREPGQHSRRHLVGLVLDHLDSLTVYAGFRRALKESGQADVMDAVDRALEQENRYMGYVRRGICTCCLLYTSPSPRDRQKSRMPSSA